MWGTTREQVRKDHLISHLLYSIQDQDGFTFFGGTALNRTDTQNRRLSEDIDLFQVYSQPGDPSVLVSALRQGTRREFPDLTVSARGVRGDVANYAIGAEDLLVKLQIVGPRTEDSRHRVSARPVAMRYSDLPTSVDLPVPSIDSFVAMKFAAFEDRRAPRDLFDLGSLADIGAINDAAIRALRNYRGRGPTQWAYGQELCPSIEQWQAELASQTRTPGEPQQVLERVRAVLSEVCRW
jgi:predicted nucleotidyltransferase component of viral defense system